MSSVNKETKNSNTRSACVIVQGTVIEGEFFSKSDTRLDGIITGNVVCEAKLIMGNSSEITGNVKSHEVLIAGKFDGEMNVKESLSLKGTAKMNGQITTKKVDIEEGAIINGNISTK
jgi:cytoskeletal protein CcmA (bactofilin family)